MQGSIFRLLSRRSDQAIIKGPDHILRLPQLGDFQQWKDLRTKSRDFLQPWEPTWSLNELSERAFKARIARSEQEYNTGIAVPLFIFDAETNTLLGGITIGHIRRGVGQNCMIGYWIGEPFSGQGHMKAALDLTIHHIFTRLQLHRIEAACIPENERSVGLLEKAGFRHEGLLRKYLKINGEWRDHSLLALLEEDRVKQKTGHL